jgi:hypothetical protein
LIVLQRHQITEDPVMVSPRELCRAVVWVKEDIVGEGTARR